MLQCKIVASGHLIPHQLFLKEWRDWNRPLFVILSLDNDEITMDLLLLDAAQLPASYPRFKQSRQNSSVSNGYEIIPLAALEHPPDICWCIGLFPS